MRTLRFNLYAALLALVGIFFVAGPASASSSGTHHSHHHSHGHRHHHSG